MPLPTSQPVSLLCCVCTQGIYQECATVLYDEIDYINEGRNADRWDQHC